jgi:hypothetical protein
VAVAVVVEAEAVEAVEVQAAAEEVGVVEEEEAEAVEEAVAAIRQRKEMSAGWILRLEGRPGVRFPYGRHPDEHARTSCAPKVRWAT